MVSLLSFILTGELGSLKLGMEMREVSELLGPPDWWTGGDRDISPVPILWGYRQRFLEVFFETEPPYVVDCIKICQLPPIGRKYLPINWWLWISTDGMNDEMKLSDALGIEIWKSTQDVTVGISKSWNPVIDIVTDKVRLVWSMLVDGEETLEKQAGKGLSAAAYAVLRDQLSHGFLGIYSHSDPKAGRAPREGWEDFSQAGYLALMNTGR